MAEFPPSTYKALGLQYHINWAPWHMSLMPELRRWRRENQKFSVTLVSIYVWFEDSLGHMKPCFKEHCTQMGIYLCLGLPGKLLELLLLMLGTGHMPAKELVPGT